jgi:hypothetical protein
VGDGRRLPLETQKHEVLFGECLAGALYNEDFKRLAREVGFTDPRWLQVCPPHPHCVSPTLCLPHPHCVSPTLCLPHTVSPSPPLCLTHTVSPSHCVSLTLCLTHTVSPSHCVSLTPTAGLAHRRARRRAQGGVRRGALLLHHVPPVQAAGAAGNAVRGLRAVRGVQGHHPGLGDRLLAGRPPPVRTHAQPLRSASPCLGTVHARVC